MHRPLPALLALCLVPLACTATTTHADNNEPKPNTTGETKDADANPPAPTDPGGDSQAARAPVAADTLPDCPAGDGALALYCTDEGKLAGQWVPVDTLKVPDDVEIIFNADGPDTTRQTSLMIATRGDELYIRHVTCGACRRVMGQGFAGHLSHMSEAQLRELQGQLGLDAELPLLESAESWTNFCGDERGKGALTQIAAKADGDASGR